MTQTTTRVLSAALAAVVALATFSLYTFQAAAYDRHDRGGDEGIEVDIENKASVNNVISVQAKTGYNEAEGGDGGRGDDGGDASRGIGGAGGAGGAGGHGGTIETGDAAAFGYIFNDVNYSNVYVEGCGCDDEPLFGRMMFLPFLGGDDEEEPVDIDIENRARLSNVLDVDAKTGGNEADGGDGGSGGDGGDVRSHSRHSWNMWLSWFNKDAGGAGGDGGAGGVGGTVRTGNAYAEGEAKNLLNTTVVRVLRGAAEEEVQS